MIPASTKRDPSRIKDSEASARASTRDTWPVHTLEVRSRHLQDYLLLNLADGTAWQPAPAPAYPTWAGITQSDTPTWKRTDNPLPAMAETIKSLIAELEMIVTWTMEEKKALRTRELESIRTKIQQGLALYERVEELQSAADATAAPTSA